ncbi:hypothetical protein BYT27DRAFT_6774247 [Phlegmacium glaucopus]|nr:hypothetical protein BYT27DRAFT_6774247 [Phlegmacium glaucopus]
MSSKLEVTKILTPMKRKEDALSIESLNAQINAMMQAICLIEDKDSRTRFTKRIEVVQRDLHYLRSKLQSHIPRNSMRPTTLNIDHSLRSTGSSEEGYISSTWQDVLDITQRIDSLSEGLAFVIQHHNRHLQVSSSNEDLQHDLHSDYPGDSNPYTQDIRQTTYSESRRTNELDGTNYAFEYSQSNPDGHQVQMSFSHARRYYQAPSNNFQGDQRNQFIQGPNYSRVLNPQSTNMNDRFTTSTSSQLGATRNHSYGYPTGHPSNSLSYFPEGRHSQHGRPSSQIPNMPQLGPSFW